MRNTKKYAAIGYVVSKVVLPLARKRMKKAAKNKAQGSMVAVSGAARRNPGRTSVVVGAAVGAVGWLLTRKHQRTDDE